MIPPLAMTKRRIGGPAEAKPVPSATYLRECFRYEDGELFWIARPSKHFRCLRDECAFNGTWAGKRASSPMKNGYRLTGVNGKKYLEHRLIYEMMIGSLRQDASIDHIDHDRSNNRITNLRQCSHAENSANQPGRRDGSTPKHVYFSKNENKWKVQIRAGGEVHFFGTFASMEEAARVAEAARSRLHGSYGDSRSARS